MMAGCAWGGRMVWEKNESKNSWTLFFFTTFPPHILDSVFFRAPKLTSALDYPSATFQHQGSGNSFRGAKGSLYWFCPIQILSKCWGWSNIVKRKSRCLMQEGRGCGGRLCKRVEGWRGRPRVLGRRAGGRRVVCSIPTLGWNLVWSDPVQAAFWHP